MSASPPAVSFLDLGVQLEECEGQIEEALNRVVRSREFILGRELLAFEHEFASYCGAEGVVGVASGTDALELALRGLGIGPGDEVITVSHTFMATPLAISATGAVPVFVDVGAHDGLIDPEAAAAAITGRTKAIIPVHLYGRCADMDAIGGLARSHGLRIVEDAAQAHGAIWHGRRAGTLGDVGCFSFYPSKNLGAFGDGGATVSDDAELNERIRRLRNYGQTSKYQHACIGRNSRLDELQAAVLRVKLARLDDWNEARRRVAREYSAGLADSCATPLGASGIDHVFHLYVVRVKQREELRRHLAQAGIATLIHYPVPCHKQAPYMDLAQREALQTTETLAGEVLSLPMYPQLRPEQVSAVCDAIRSFLPAAHAGERL